MRATKVLAVLGFLWNSTAVSGSACRPRQSSSSLSSTSSVSSSSPSSSPSSLSSSLSVSPSSSLSLISSIPSSASTPASSSASSLVVPSPSPSPALCTSLVKNPFLVAAAGGGIESWTVASADFETQRRGYPGVDCGTDPGDPPTCYAFYNSEGYYGFMAVFQTGIPVVPGTTYTLSLRYRVMLLTGSKILYIGANQVNQASVQLTPSVELGVWKTLSASWTAPTTGSGSFPDPNVVMLQFTLSESSGAKDIQFSDFFINTCAEGSAV